MRTRTYTRISCLQDVLGDARDLSRAKLVHESADLERQVRTQQMLFLQKDSTHTEVHTQVLCSIFGRGRLPLSSLVS